MPKTNNKTSKLFLAYAKSFIQQTWKMDSVLRDEDVPSVAKWLENANYTGSRKEQLMNLAKDLHHMLEKHAKVESFVKQEGYYPEPKNARGINSPTDESKTILGALCSAIDKSTFKAGYFVKGTNPRDWPKKILDTLGMEPVTETDFSAFESHHSGVFSEVINFWMLHMIRNLTRIKPMKDLISRLVLGRNDIVFKHIKVETDQRLMSGALWTSSSNGILNLVIMSYLAARAQTDSIDPEVLAEWSCTSFKGFVEGDDGLCLDYGITDEAIEDLGVNLDMTPHKNFTEANFCGIVCDSAALIVLKDPLAAICKMMLLPPKYAQASEKRQMALLRARALSYLCNFSKNPVLASCCHWVLRQTRGYTLGNASAVLDMYHRDYAQLAESELKATGFREEKILISSRLICEERFGLSVAEQLRIEKIFQECSSQVCQIDLMCHTPDRMFEHALNFLYKPSSVPLMGPCEYPPIVSEILNAGLKPRALSRKCKMVNKRFKRVCPQVLPVDLYTGLGD